MQISITKIFPSGSLELSTIADGRRISHIYQGYTRTEARRLFRAYVKRQTKE